ncbi:MAG: putative DNA-binding domain-containing protein [Proteobacteria bacterium]|nr:putative DNA-binding domain-containing protein [Pseudomonadota bacterium]
MPSLADLQRGMRRSLLLGDAAIAALIVEDGIAPAVRLGIHRSTFGAVATRALRLNHPAVAKLVGDDFFEGAARAYVAKRPPASAWLDGYGAGFAGFLASFAPAANLDYLADVARLEWSVSRALHAPAACALDAHALASLAALDPARQSAVRFTAHPSLRLLRTRAPADAIWRATLASDDQALAAIDPHAGPRWLLVARGAPGIEVVALSERAWRFTCDLAAGRSLQQALARVGDDRTGGALPIERFDPAALLGAHLAAGRFTAFRVTDALRAADPLRATDPSQEILR